MKIKLLSILTAMLFSSTITAAGYPLTSGQVSTSGDSLSASIPQPSSHPPRTEQPATTPGFWTKDKIEEYLKHPNEKLKNTKPKVATAILKALAGIAADTGQNSIITPAKVALLANVIKTWKAYNADNIKGILKHLGNTQTAFNALGKKVAAAILKALVSIEVNDEAFPPAKVILLANVIKNWIPSSINGLLKHLGNSQDAFNALGKDIATDILKYLSTRKFINPDTMNEVQKKFKEILLKKIALLANVVETWDKDSIKGLLKHLSDTQDAFKLTPNRAAAILKALANIGVNDKAFPPAKVALLANVKKQIEGKEVGVTWNELSIKGLLRHLGAAQKNAFNKIIPKTATAILKALAGIAVNKEDFPPARVALLANVKEQVEIKEVGVTWDKDSIRGLLKHLGTPQANFNALGKDVATDILETLANVAVETGQNAIITPARVALLANVVKAWDKDSIKGILKHLGDTQDAFDALGKDVAAAILEALDNAETVDVTIITLARVALLANIPRVTWTLTSIKVLFKYGKLDNLDKDVATDILEVLANVVETDQNAIITPARVALLANIPGVTWTLTSIKGLFKYGKLDNLDKDVATTIFTALAGIDAETAPNAIITSDKVALLAKLVETWNADNIKGFFKHGGDFTDIGENVATAILEALGNSETVDDTIITPTKVALLAKLVEIWNADNIKGFLRHLDDTQELTPKTVTDIFTALAGIKVNEGAFPPAKVALLANVIQTWNGQTLTAFAMHTTSLANSAENKALIKKVFEEANKLEIGETEAPLTVATLTKLFNLFVLAHPKDDEKSITKILVDISKKIEGNITSLHYNAIKILRPLISTDGVDTAFKTAVEQQKDKSIKEPKKTKTTAVEKSAEMQQKKDADKISSSSGAFITASVLGTAAAVVGFAVFGPLGIGFGFFAFLAGILLGNFDDTSSAKKTDVNAALTKQAVANTTR